ncbi:DUF2272 domain-containing protein [Sorangium sp. So ce260]|uniref:SPOR domain-containing protein n=1 Tax=Sorangium sp. So ce260 TaxID=3133291 RepID=UPI003F5E68D7
MCELCATIQRVANAELRAWRTSEGGLILESSRQGQERINTYWSYTVGTAGHPYEEPWSAVFVCYCVRRAVEHLAARRPSVIREVPLTMPPSGRHWEYAQSAYNERRPGFYRAIRTNEHVPQVGDIVLRTRANSGITYDSLRGQASGAPSTHGDIVVAVAPDKITVIGGNKSRDWRNPNDRNGVTCGSSDYVLLPNRTIDTGSLLNQANGVFAVLTMHQRVPHINVHAAVAGGQAAVAHQRVRPPPLALAPGFYVQTESGTNGDGANRSAGALMRQGFPAHVQRVGTRHHRVLVGPYETREEAESARGEMHLSEPEARIRMIEQ